MPPLASPRARLLNLLFDGMTRVGIFASAHALNPNLLTVLNYHRIDDIYRAGFDTFKPNVSANTDEFARQMDYVTTRFNVITCNDLISWLQDGKPLPPHAALITFDDGYYDNLSYAYPILRKRGATAVIFLTTDFIGSNIPFYWDLVAYSFSHTRKDHVQLPFLGDCQWDNEATRDKIMLAWIETLKKLPEGQKRELIQRIASLLDVSIPADAFSGLYLTWDQIRDMGMNGIEFGTHTVNHPILTRISLNEVRQELMESKKKIEGEIGKPILSLAYPNGQASDYSDEIINVVREAGIQLAFTLLPGPTRYSTVKKEPLAIRRIYVGRSDTFPRFVAKLSGVARLNF